MHKRIIGAVIAVALVAFAAVPAFASASPVLKDSSGTVPVNSLIKATNVGNIKMTTSLGTIECQTSVLTGKVTTNSGSEIAGDIETATFTGTGSEGKCTTAFLGDIKVEPKKLPWCIRAGGKLPADTFTVAAGACTGAASALEFTLNSSFAGACTYTRANVEGKFNTGPPEALLTVSESEFTKSAGGFLCPSSGKLDMTYTLETDTAEHPPIWIE